MALYIICHRDLPAYPLPSDAQVMWMSAAEPPPGLGLRFIRGYEFFDDAVALHLKLSGSLGSAAIARHLEGLPERPPTVTIWQYRKFITRAEFGRPAPNFPGMRLLTPVEAAAARPSPDWSGGGQLTARPLVFDSVMKQYARHHNLIDLLRYLTVAIEVGALTQNQAISFLDGKHFIPGGLEGGTYETTGWLEDFRVSFAATLGFIDRFAPHDRDHPYQSRAVSFCQERLGSFLLLERRQKAALAGLPAAPFGVIHTITAEGAYRGGSA